MYVCLCVRLYVCLYVCMYVCMYVCNLKLCDTNYDKLHNSSKTSSGPLKIAQFTSDLFTISSVSAVTIVCEAITSVTEVYRAELSEGPVSRHM